MFGTAATHLHSFDHRELAATDPTDTSTVSGLSTKDHGGLLATLGTKMLTSSNLDTTVFRESEVWQGQNLYNFSFKN